MSYTTLDNLKQLAQAYSGNDNPGIFLTLDNYDDPNYGIEPTCVFVDDDGDIIIQFDIKKALDILIKLTENLIED